MLSTELVPLTLDQLPAVAAVAPVPVLPAVGALDLYAALLADARKPTTWRAREQVVLDLTRFLATAGPVEACALFVAGGAPQANVIATAYTRSMLDRGLSPATINRRVSTLRRLAKLGRRVPVITWGLDVDSQRVESYRDTTGPGRSGWLQLLDVATKAAARTAKGKRDLAIVRLLHDQALRRGELVALDLADVHLDAGRLLVMGKGEGEKAPMTLNAPTLLALSHWVDARGPEPGPLFIHLDRARPKGEPARLDGDDLAVRQLSRKAKLARPVRPHGLRHEAVTRVSQLTNGNIDAGQKFARHADPKTTQRYNDNRSDVAGAMARLLGDDL
jgi:integrase/recombinase XerC